jgi:hypothetical protein
MDTNKRELQNMRICLNLRTLVVNSPGLPRKTKGKGRSLKGPSLF